MKKIIITAWVTLVLALVIGVPAAQACATPPPTVPPVTIQLHEQCFPINDPTDCMIRGWITYHNYTTFGTSTNTFCSCALKKVGKIKTVLWVKFIDPVTGKRYPSWTFDPNAGTTSNAAQFLGNGNIAGYLAETTKDIPTGTNLDLMLEVIFEGDAGIAGIASALNNSGPVLVTGEADSNGNYIGHVGVVPQQPTTCLVQDKMTAYVGDALSVWAERGVEIDATSLVACDIDGQIVPDLSQPAVLKAGASVGSLR